jgi:hypothetical protein
VGDVLFKTRLADGNPSGSFPFGVAENVAAAVATLKGTSR